VTFHKPRGCLSRQLSSLNGVANGANLKCTRTRIPGSASPEVMVRPEPPFPYGAGLEVRTPARMVLASPNKAECILEHILHHTCVRYPIEIRSYRYWPTTAAGRTLAI
jgi:hypothetical protein